MTFSSASLSQSPDGHRASLFRRAFRSPRTQPASRVVDSALQLRGGEGVVAVTPVVRRYREVRALRIDAGTSEIQKLVIARELIG